MAKANKKQQQNDLRDEVFLELIPMIPRDNQGRKELAKEANVSPGMLYNWTHGSTFSPRLTSVVKVARALGYAVTLRRVHQKGLRRVK